MLNQGLILSTVTLPSIPISDTDGIPSHSPRCVKPMGGFNGFPVGLGGRSEIVLTLRIAVNCIFQ